MGASGWQHFVPYQPDIGLALTELREEVFRRGTYYAPPRARKAASIQELVQRCGESGTHSVMDVSCVVATPLPVPALKWHAEIFARTGAPPSPADFQGRLRAELALMGQVAPLSAAQQLAVFGAHQPTHATVEACAYNLFSLLPRGCALYVLVGEDAGQPSEIFFAGKTGD